jgi:hypothetical protein
MVDHGSITALRAEPPLMGFLFAVRRAIIAEG